MDARLFCGKPPDGEKKMSATGNGSVDLTQMEAVFQRYQGQRGALIPILQQAQSHYGHVPPPVIEHIADRLGLSVGEVFGTATFYALLDQIPPPEGRVRVCRDGPCRLAGGEAVWGAAQASGDRIEAYSCLGHCYAGPVAMVDTHIVAKLTPEVWTQGLPEAVHEPVPILTPPQKRRLLANVGQIDPESLDDYQAADGYSALRHALSEMSPQQVIEAVTESGLQGRGGAGFPAGRKWAFTAQASGEPKYVICNADESEPGTFKDRALLEGDPHRVLEGMILAGYAVGAEHGVIYVRGEYLPAYRRLQKAVDQARAAGLLGQRILGSEFSFEIELHLGSGAYICGEETALIESLEGKRGEPRMRPPYPPTYGLWGQPTVVNNVETLANVPDIVRDGAEAFKAAETKLYCLSGHVAHRGLIEAPLGLTLRQAIEDYGGGMANGVPFGLAQTGGAAGTIVGPEALDVPLTFTSAQTQGVALGSGALLVADESVPLVDLLLSVMEFFARESCGKCFPCRYGTLRAQEILARLAAGEGEADDWERLGVIARELAVASFCGLGQAAAVPLQSGLKMIGNRERER